MFVASTELQMTEQKSTNPTSSFSQNMIAAMKNEESNAPLPLDTTPTQSEVGFLKLTIIIT